MTTTMLVLLVGELLTPFQGDFRRALPAAFPGGVPQVGVGLNAPPGRTVAWITVRAEGLEIEVVLHTARVPGDLRRVLRFAPEDAPKDRARAAAFTLAAMVREHDADLLALETTSPETSAGPRWWVASASLYAGMDVPGLHAGGGVRFGLRREVFPWLHLGATIETGLFSTPAAALLQPAVLAEAAIPLTRGGFSTAVVLGGGVAAPILSREGSNFTTWLGVVQLTLEGRLALGPGHGLRFALSGQFVPTPLSVQVGQEALTSVGPLWLRPEVGYSAEL